MPFERDESSMEIDDQTKRDVSEDIAIELSDLRVDGATEQELVEVVQVALERSKTYAELKENVTSSFEGDSFEECIQNISSQMEPAD
jgi:hypothetical protein